MAPSAALSARPVTLSPLEALLERMQAQGDFPALSQSISTVNRVISNIDESVQTLSTALLKDFALTNKLLRLVNSVAYGRYGGTISTISRAVMILGFDVVRSLAVTLTLFEHMQKNSQFSRLREEVLGAYFTGILSRRVCASSGTPDSEEGFICGVFHPLGRLIATYYFYEESQEVDKRLQRGESENKASQAVLGVTYADLGMGVARHWQLPEKIIASMQPPPAVRTQKPATQAERLRLVANMAAGLSRIASQNSPEQRAIELERLRKDYSGGLNLGKAKLPDLVEDCVRQFLSESALLVTDSGKSRLLAAVRHWTAAKISADQTGHETPATIDSTADISMAGESGAQAFLPNADSAAPCEDTADEYRRLSPGECNAALTAGIQDITNALVGEYDLDELLNSILETMHRSMGFSQVLLCTRDARGTALLPRYGLGAGIPVLLKCFNVQLGQARDVFQLAANKNVDVYIADTRSDSVSHRIPEWFRAQVNADAFLLLPMVAGGKPIGMIYAGYDSAGELAIEPHLLQMLKTLRNQAILAIRQKT